MSAPETESEWIEWAGGECPVAAETLVDVRHRDGEVFTDQPAASTRRYAGGRFIGAARNWVHDDVRGDIVAYRAVQP